MRVIWGVAQNHEADGSGRCSCGKSELSCPDLNAIADEIAYLNQWNTRRSNVLSRIDRMAFRGSTRDIGSGGSDDGL